MASAKETVEKLLAIADIKVNGDSPWDIRVHNEDFYKRVISGGSLALGESYMDGWWDVKELDEFFHKILRVNLNKHVVLNYHTVYLVLKSILFNLQSKVKSKKVGEQHYDISNDFYKSMLDDKMVYTCGYWKEAETLDRAQEDKLDLVCRKLGLKEGMTVLDIGCGWGSFVKYAAERYGVKAVGITISKEQAALAEENVKGLPVEIRFQDYRDVKEKFDRIVSLGMFEHVGYKNYLTYMKAIEKNLKDDSLFLLHTIGRNKSLVFGDPWFEKYIFPGGMLPSAKQIATAYENVLVMEDWHNFGSDYDKTLIAWFSNFHKNWHIFEKQYGNRFYRMWKYYLLCSAGSFRARRIQLWQIMLSKKGIEGGYDSIR